MRCVSYTMMYRLDINMFQSCNISMLGLSLSTCVAFFKILDCCNLNWCFPEFVNVACCSSFDMRSCCVARTLAWWDVMISRWNIPSQDRRPVPSCVRFHSTLLGGLCSCTLLYGCTVLVCYLSLGPLAFPPYPCYVQCFVLIVNMYAKRELAISWQQTVGCSVSAFTFIFIC